MMLYNFSSLVIEILFFPIFYITYIKEGSYILHGILIYTFKVHIIIVMQQLLYTLAFCALGLRYI